VKTFSFLRVNFGYMLAVAQLKCPDDWMQRYKNARLSAILEEVGALHWPSPTWI
jgi:hypothetical protein